MLNTFYAFKWEIWMEIAPKIWPWRDTENIKYGIWHTLIEYLITGLRSLRSALKNEKNGQHFSDCRLTDYNSLLLCCYHVGRRDFRSTGTVGDGRLPAHQGKVSCCCMNWRCRPNKPHYGSCPSVSLSVRPHGLLSRKSQRNQNRCERSLGQE